MKLLNDSQRRADRLGVLLFLSPVKGAKLQQFRPFIERFNFVFLDPKLLLLYLTQIN